MWKWVLGLSIVAAVVLVSSKAVAAVKGGSDLEKMRKLARNLSPAVVAIARKHAAAKGVPLQEVVATILRESGGKPRARKLTSAEDSRGLMQVNVRAHSALLARKKMGPDDLYDPDKGVDVGTELYADARKHVAALVAKSAVPQWKQAHSLDTLTRLYYAGPRYVTETLQKAQSTEDTKHLFRNSETYVDHWRNAMQAVREAGIA